MRKRQKWESVNKRLEETFEYKLMSFRKKNAQKGFPGDLVGKESACSIWDPDLIPGTGRSTGEGDDNPL